MIKIFCLNIIVKFNEGYIWLNFGGRGLKFLEGACPKKWAAPIIILFILILHSYWTRKYLCLGIFEGTSTPRNLPKYPCAAKPKCQYTERSSAENFLGFSGIFPEFFQVFWENFWDFSEFFCVIFDFIHD